MTWPCVITTTIAAVLLMGQAAAIWYLRGRLAQSRALCDVWRHNYDALVEKYHKLAAGWYAAAAAGQALAEADG